MAANKVKIIFLGTNGWYDTDTGNTICVLIDAPSAYIVLDAGNGIYKLDRYIRENKPIYLFISHLHIDHIEGLHIMAKFKFKQQFFFCLPKGKKKQFDIFMNWPYTIPPNELKLNIKVLELKRKSHIFSGIKVVQLPLRHIGGCTGYRFEFSGKVIAYVPDTGLCDNAYKLAKNADLVITECAMKSGGGDVNWPHLNPKTAAVIAQKANAGKLALVHFDAEIYQTLGEREKAGKIAQKTFKNTIVAKDGMRFSL